MTLAVQFQHLLAQPVSILPAYHPSKNMKSREELIDDLKELLKDAEKYGKDADLERNEALRKLGIAISERDAAVDACRALMVMIGNGTLVRDISKDSEPGFAVRQITLVRALKWAQDVIDKDEEKSSPLIGVGIDIDPGPQ